MNSPATHEHASYRIVVGNNTSTVHPVLGTFPAKGCIPLPVTDVGTFSTDNAGATAGLVVLGVGTSFLTGTTQTRPEKGDYLCDTNFVLRRIKSVDSDTKITLDAKFPSSVVAGTAVKIVRRQQARFITAESTGTAAANLNEQNFAIGSKWFNDGTPVSYDVSTANSEISFNLSV